MYYNSIHNFSSYNSIYLNNLHSSYTKRTSSGKHLCRPRRRLPKCLCRSGRKSLRNVLAVVLSATARTVSDLRQELSLLCTEPDGPHLVASSPHVRRGGGVHQQHLDLTPRERPRQGGEIVEFVFRSVCYARRLLDDIESKIGEKGYVPIYSQSKGKETKDILI